MLLASVVPMIRGTCNISATQLIAKLAHERTCSKSSMLTMWSMRSVTGRVHRGSGSSSWSLLSNMIHRVGTWLVSLSHARVRIASAVKY